MNGSCWQVPLVGGVLDRVFAEPDTLTVQKLGTLYDAHPALALPDWATYTTLTIETDVGSLVFAGSAGQYEDFLFPANGSYKATMTVWRLPNDLLSTQFDGGTNGAIHKNWGQEHPARPTGWYRFSFRFTLQASANVELSAERVEQGGIVGVAITGMAGDTAPPWRPTSAVFRAPAAPPAGGPTSLRPTTPPPEPTRSASRSTGRRFPGR